ncbi:MAG: protein kinase domain-containing protein [Acidothermaceae bacterium]
MDEFSLAGYDVEGLLGFGGSGEVWSARESTTGERVALKRLRGTDGAPSRELQREAALLASARHEHVVRLRSVVPTASGLVLVLDFAAGGSLATLLGVRSRLTAAEVVTVGAPLAQALADVHERGLVHGDVTPANIVFDGSGKPLLADLGVARLVGESPVAIWATAGFADPAVLSGAPATPASDVYGLGAACFAALTGVAPSGTGGRESIESMVPGVPSRLAAAIEAALDADPRARPDPASLARSLYAACSAQPVRLVHGRPDHPPLVDVTHQVTPSAARPPAAPVAPPRSAGRHRVRALSSPGARATARRLALPLIAIALLAGAVLVGVSWAAHGRSAAASAPADTTTPAGTAPPASLDVQPSPATPSVAGDQRWAQVMAALDRLRDGAFIDVDPGELSSVYLPTSPALRADLDSLGELQTARQHARGLNLQLRSVAVRSETPTEVVLAVDDVLPAYDLVGADGSAVHQAGRGERAWVVTLRAQTSGGPWRIDTISVG